MTSPVVPPAHQPDTTMALAAPSSTTRVAATVADSNWVVRWSR